MSLSLSPGFVGPWLDGKRSKCHFYISVCSAPSRTRSVYATKPLLFFYESSFDNACFPSQGFGLLPKEIDGPRRRLIGQLCGTQIKLFSWKEKGGLGESGGVFSLKLPRSWGGKNGRAPRAGPSPGLWQWRSANALMVVYHSWGPSYYKCRILYNATAPLLCATDSVLSPPDLWRRCWRRERSALPFMVTWACMGWKWTLHALPSWELRSHLLDKGLFKLFCHPFFLSTWLVIFCFSTHSPMYLPLCVWLYIFENTSWHKAGGVVKILSEV
jgi:hypothetical protein